MLGEDQGKGPIIQKNNVQRKKKLESFESLWRSHFRVSMQPDGVPVDKKSIKNLTARFTKVMQYIVAIVSYRKVDMILDETKIFM